MPYTPSVSLKKWTEGRSKNLDELNKAHAKVGGTKRGRRYSTGQLNHSLVLAIAAQFQGFCKDLHRDAAQLIAAEAGANLKALVLAGLTHGRALDRANPNARTLRDDFSRLSLDIWPA